MIRNSKKLKIFIFGGSGLLGSHCVKYFKKNYDVKWTYYNPYKKEDDSLHFSCQEDDAYQKLYSYIEDFKPDVVINALGFVSVDKSENEPELAKLLNKDFLTMIVSALKKLNNKCYLVQVSSGGVYGNHKNNNKKSWKEEDDLNAMSVYASTKVQGEQEALKHEGPVLILRSDFYGLNFFRDRFTLLSWIIHNAENSIQMDGWENIYFSPISADKLTKTIEKCINLKIEGIFNVGSEDSCSKYDFVEAVCKVINTTPIIIKNEIKSNIRPRDSVLCCDKIKKNIVFECKWRDVLSEYLNTNYTNG